MSKVNREAIEEIIERVTARESLELVHWETIGPRHHFTLRIFIDKPSGVTHADCEVVSNQVGALLDMEDLIDGGYLLEVSSPGIERGLYKQSDYQRFAGQRIRLKTFSPINGQRNFHGLLVGIAESVITLTVDGVGDLQIPFEQIAKANIEYEF